MLTLSDFIHTATCPEGYKMYDNACYKYFKEQKTWEEAAKFCHKQQASLVSIKNAEEDRFVRLTIAPTGMSSREKCWVGLSDRLNPGLMSFVDGTSAHYVNWEAQQPYITDKTKCVMIDIDSMGWMMNGCNDKLGFICKRKLKGNLIMVQDS